ncbi:MAG: DNA polymerase II, partial [Chlamydiales bacterium]|nr:DNA polymerase II [Chlamydiales bacterium]
GEKLWCTNGTAAEIIIVMALTAPKIVDGREKKQVSAFIVETNTPGFEVLHRCRFMGIRAIANGLLRFKDVKVPKENLVGELGQGLKIALTTLNTGRLTIPMISAGVGKLCLHNCKKWANQRKQWGVKIGEHQAIGNLLADMAANTFAIESTSLVVASLADNEKADIRLEAAMAKYFGSESSWTMADNALQIRGGRGFEQEKSLKERGEDPFPIERILRDIRINRIIEGTSEIMRLFIAREAMDVHLKHIFPLLNPKKSNKEKLQAVGTMLKFYSKWYPTLYFPAQSSFDVKHLNSKNLAHLRYIAKTAKRLGRGLFHTMQKYQKKLEKEQVLLQQYVDIGTDLFAMACSLARAEHISALKPTDSSCQELVDLFCSQARDRIEACFKKVGTNHNAKMGQVSSHVLQGSFDWMCENVIK